MLRQNDSIYPPTALGVANEGYTVCLDKDVVNRNAVVRKCLVEVLPTSDHHFGPGEAGTPGIGESMAVCHQCAERQKIAAVDGVYEGESDLVGRLRHVNSWLSKRLTVRL